MANNRKCFCFWRQICLLGIWVFSALIGWAQTPKDSEKPPVFKDTSLIKYWYYVPEPKTAEVLEKHLKSADNATNKLEKGFYVAKTIPLGFESRIARSKELFQHYLREYPYKKGHKTELYYIYNKAYYFYFRNELDSAKEYFIKGINFPMDEDNDHYVAQVNFHARLGAIYARGSNPEESVKHFKKAFMYAEKTKDPLILAYINSLAGISYGLWGTMEETNNFYRKAATFYKQAGAEYRMVAIYNNTAYIMANVGQKDSAFYYIRRALSLRSPSGKIDSMAFSSFCHTMAEICNKYQMPDSALFYINLSFKIQPKVTPDPELVALLNFERGRALVQKKKYYQAQPYFMGFYKYAEKEGNYFRKIDALQSIIEIAVNTGNFKEAATYYALDDSLQKQFNQDELKRQFSEFNSKLQVENSKAELAKLKMKQLSTEGEIQAKELSLYYAWWTIVLFVVFLSGLLLLMFYLKKKNNLLLIQTTEIEKQTLKLQAAAATKDRMFSIIAHDLRGPIGNLNSLPDMLGSIWETTDKQAITHFAESLKMTLNSVYDLLENLLQWAAAVDKREEEKLENIRVDILLQETLSLLQPLATSKEIEILLLIDKGFPPNIDGHSNILKTILRNVLGNAIKFSFRGTKVILGATANPQTNRPMFYVQDFGVGMSNEQVENLFSDKRRKTSKGTEGEASGGLGMLLVKDLALSVGYELQISSSEGSGTTIRIVV